MKKTFMSVLLLLGLFTAVAESFSYSELFKSYCDSDLQLEELSVSLSQSELSLHKQMVSSDMSWSLSTGNTELGFGSDGVDFSTSPSLSLSFPSASNTTIKITSPVSWSFAGSDANFTLSGAGIKASSDFINAKDETNALSIEKSERSVLEAERKIAARELTLEKSFLNELKTLYNGKLSVYEAEQSLLSAQTSLETLTAQGYEKTSLKYKKAEMSLKTAEHKRDQAEYSYNSQLALFCTKTGISVTGDFSVDIPDVKLASIYDYPKEKYTAIESADWSSYINTRNRAITSDVTLSSNEGVSFSKGGTNARSGDDFSATISAGLTATINDLSFSAGVDVPINSSKKPSLNLSLTWTPSNKEAAVVDEMTVANNIKQEAFAKKEAEAAYEDAVASYNVKKDNITWEYNMNVEELKMYSEYLDDIEKWYKQGLVSRSEYLQAENSYENSYYAVIVSKIDKLIYNLELKALFVSN